MTRSRGVAVAIAVSMLSGFRASAQDVPSLLDARLDSTTRVPVERVIAAARADRLPIAPLVNKALEGASKGASGPRIIAAVQALAQNLGAARQALGSAATEPEIVGGSDALRAGARPETLRDLRTAGGPRSLAVPLTVLSALVGRGVPVDTAVTVVIALASRRAPDRDFLDLQRAVERDIGAGMAPGSAAAIRAPAGPPVGVPPRHDRPGPGQPPPRR